jgi:hypothetical protein
MVCIPLPQETAADLLLGANVVVLARENPQKPFSYVAVEVLKGNLAAPGIDRFVDSTTRRRLALNPNRSVVLTLGGPEFPARASFWSPRSRDASPSRWRSLGYASPRYEAVVREILALAPRWREGVGLEARATYFMPYLTDAERPIRELAYLEVGQASYDTIRKADRFVPAEQLHAFLTDPQYLEWRALYILLLGVNANQHEKETIRAAIASRAHFNQTLNLSAWATALIEIDGERAVDWLEAMYLGTPDREPDAVLQVVKALSVQGAGERSGLRARIAESYGVLIEAHPSLAGWVAHDLTAWNDWRFAEALVDLRASQAELDSATAYAIDFYIARATSGASDRVRPLRAP